jgi:hypothetical protein
VLDVELQLQLEELHANLDGIMKTIGTLNDFKPPHWDPLEAGDLPDVDVDEIEFEKRAKQ